MVDATDMMNAIVFKEPHVVKIEKRPIPSIQHPKDIVVQTLYTALCGRSVFVTVMCISITANA